jgi:hypothetical protein
LRSFRDQIQNALGVSLTDARIVEAMHRDEVPSDLLNLLQKLEAFRMASP